MTAPHPPRAGALVSVIALVMLTALPCRFGGAARAAEPLRVRAGESLASVSDKLAADPSVAEVVFEAGTYRGGLTLRPPKSPGTAAPRPLLLRPADGAAVVFDGSALVEGLRPDGSAPALFRLDYAHDDGEYPKFWEPATRSRYRLVADRRSVARFPATYTVEGDALLLHPSDGRAPAPGELLTSAADVGVYISRPDVTVRGISFRNYLAREKWSCGVQVNADRVTLEDCSAINCSHGFVVSGRDNVVRRCSTDDVGGGVYNGGENTAVEHCRFFKRRDAYMIPMYAQDDTAVQYYAPARGGTVRGNLCVGFGMGVFLKATPSPWVVEHNTIVGLGQGLGFGSTSWHEGQRFRYNVVAECDRLVEAPEGGPRRPEDVSHNCYWSSEKELKPLGPGDVVADPKFAWPQRDDYRPAEGSPCLKLADAAGPCGALPAVDGSATAATEAKPREWHVSETGRDGLDGSSQRPLRTIQYAVDRAAPGDTVVVHPGLYPDPVRITRGGTKDRPIVVRAAERWKAVLDCNRTASTMVSIDRAPHVELRGLEIRWYRDVAVRIEDSPNVSAVGCRIWNAHWHGAWPTGTAFRVERSPGFAGRDNVLFRQEHAFWFYHSPRFTLAHNTCASNLYSAVAALYSCEGSTCRNNSFAFQGNDVVVIEVAVGEKDKLKAFDCDYNNYGTWLRDQPPGTPFDRVTPREKDAHVGGGSKALVNYNEYGGKMQRFVSLEAWRRFSGLDGHTIVADPLYVDTGARDFRLEANSPNRRAGAGGATIGAPAGPASDAPGRQ